MALPVTMYRWDDEGAPQVVDAKPSEFINILKKCLVEGYGDKQPLGWLTDFEQADPPFIAISNDADKGFSGGTITVSSIDDAPKQNMTFQSCLNFVSKDSLNRPGAYFTFDSSNSSSYIKNKWFLIGTASAFYFFAIPAGSYSKNYTSSNGEISFFAGDFNTFYANDPARFITLCGPLDNSSPSWANTFLYRISDGLPENVGYIYGLDASDERLEYSIISLGTGFAMSSKETKLDLPVMLSPSYLAMGKGYVRESYMYNESKFPFLRGIIPGLFSAIGGGFRDEPQPVIKEIGNKNYYLLPSTNSRTCCAWIDLEEW